MSLHFVLIDFENVQPESVGALNPAENHVKVFAGEHQNRIEFGLAQALQPFGSNAEYIRIVGNGKDALDFHIAFYIGKLSAEHPGASFTIVSRDTGFDPLVKHLAGLKIPCRRTSAIVERVASKPTMQKPVAPKPAKKSASKSTAKPIPKAASKPIVAASKARLDEALQRLQGLKAARPGTVKTLKSSLKAWFKPALNETDVVALMGELERLGKIKATGTTVAYALNSK